MGNLLQKDSAQNDGSTPKPSSITRVVEELPDKTRLENIADQVYRQLHDPDITSAHPDRKKSGPLKEGQEIPKSKDRVDSADAGKKEANTGPLVQKSPIEERGIKNQKESSAPPDPAADKIASPLKERASDHKIWNQQELSKEAKALVTRTYKQEAELHLAQAKESEAAGNQVKSEYHKRKANSLNLAIANLNDPAKSRSFTQHLLDVCGSKRNVMVGGTLTVAAIAAGLSYSAYTKRSAASEQPREVPEVPVTGSKRAQAIKR